jgi:Histidine kinase
VSPAPIPLDRPLAPELAPRLARGLAAYREYPTFSWPWLYRRSLLFGCCISAYGALAAFGLWSRDASLGRALLVALQFTGGGLGMASAGPLLATWVRHRGWPAPRERVAIVLALCAGLGVAFALDELTSSALAASLPPSPTPSPEHTGPLATLINVLVLVIIYGLLGGGLALGRYLREQAAHREVLREQELSALRAMADGLDRKLSLLQAQIEPHFLFNTLASVRSLVACDPARAEGTIDLLVDYLRATIPDLRCGDTASELGQQLRLCERYLALMAVRTGRLEYHVEAAEGLCAMPVPPLLLMTLVENAIKHGIEPKVGAGRVEVRVTEQAEDMLVRVDDDGVGLREGLSSGLGLHNLREQLRLRYAGRAGFTLQSLPGGGTRAELRLPKVRP